MKLSRSFTGRVGSHGKWFETMKEDEDYQQLQKLYTESTVKWKQPVMLPDTIDHRLVNLLPTKQSHHRQLDWEEYLHLLRKREKTNQFTEWDIKETSFVHKNDFHENYMNMYTEDLCLAYTQYKFSTTYGITTRLLTEINKRLPAFSPERVLDFGCGPGAGLAAVKNYYPKSPSVYTGIDLNPHMRNISRYINEKIDIIYYQSLIDMLKENTPRFNLILCNEVLSEQYSDHERSSLTLLLYEYLSPGGCLVISERGNRYGYHTVRSSRKFLLSMYGDDKENNNKDNNNKDNNNKENINKDNNNKENNNKENNNKENNNKDSRMDTKNTNEPLLSASPSPAPIILSPCTHCLECPLKGNKNRWCYFVQQTADLSNVSSPSAHPSGDPFSYIVFYKPYKEETISSLHLYREKPSRILLQPIKNDKHVITDLCTSNGTFERHTYTKGKMSNMKERYRAIRKSEWGGLWYDADEKEMELLKKLNEKKQ
ncbi:hypothetical protein WA158_008489 [Blastocystis sp. Blastoise]